LFVGHGYSPVGDWLCCENFHPQLRSGVDEAK
jgi:hypothetical protein